MKVPFSWLRDLVALPEDVTAAEVAARLTAAGLTVERIVSTGSEVTGPLTVGRVLSRTDEEQKNGKLVHYCRVDVGERHNDEPGEDYPASRGIICGAHNFEPGDLVVVALPGTVLPGGFEISARKTYGHISDGMICSQAELGLGSDHDGIIVLDADAGLVPGDDAIAALWSPDEVLELEVTPDLSYALSIRGIARDTAQLFELAYLDSYALPVPEAHSHGHGHPVVLEDEACPLFVALRLDEFDPAAPSPSWLVRRLEAAGMRSISLAVDVTNYVMLESGQPLHAYDATKLSGPIVVRRARAGETLVTLDGQTRELLPSDLLITDDSGPIGLAGVMGGASTEIGQDTTSIVLEAAHFDPVTVSRTMRRLNLPSEASKRFERGVDPALPYAAAHRAMSLMMKYGGGTLSQAETIAGGVATPPSITIRASLPGRILGADISETEVVSVLQRSGVSVTALGDSLTLCPPTWRPDLRDPFDYVEEVGSKLGYDRIGSRVPTAPLGRG
ncbi:MAG: phenylalanine--tRNA ligase subunit beta, partial [Propionibacteriaceae bacterium]|nr:phenylalanine--tRNA ligase subunit beta [Propionibacteriaceae bacterium]